MNFKKIEKVIILFISICLLFLTNISLIYIDIPYYIYSNIIAIFLLGIYLNIISTLIVLSATQYILYYFGQVDNFLSYSYLEILVAVMVIYILKYIIKNRYYLLVMSGIFLAIFQKIITLIIFNMFYKNDNIDFLKLVSKEYIGKGVMVQLFSVFVAGIIIKLLSFFVEGEQK